MRLLILQILSQKMNLRKKILMGSLYNDIKTIFLITKKPNNMYQLCIIRLLFILFFRRYEDIERFNSGLIVVFGQTKNHIQKLKKIV